METVDETANSIAIQLAKAQERLDRFKKMIKDAGYTESEMTEIILDTGALMAIFLRLNLPPNKRTLLILDHLREEIKIHMN